MTASHQNTHRAFLSYEDAQKWNDFMPLYFLWRGNGTEPIFKSLLLKGSSQSQLSCCSHSGWTEATSAAQVPLGLKPQDHSASLCIERARCLSLQRSAHNNTSSGSGGELAFLFWPLFLIQVWSGVGRRKKSSSPHLFKKNNMHTRHDDIVLQILTVGQLYRAATGAWIGTWCSCHGVVIQGRIEPKPSRCAEVYGTRGASEVFICTYTHMKDNLTSN